jgi:hypothetical protein
VICQQGASTVSGLAPGQGRDDFLRTAAEMEKRLDDFKLSTEELAEKSRLQPEGFPDWSRKDFKSFCSSFLQ